MRIIFGILFVATIGGTTHGTGLRSSIINGDPSSNEDYHGLEAVEHMNESEHAGNDMDSLERKKEATLVKYEDEKMDSLSRDGGVPHYAVHMKEAIESEEASVEEFIDESVAQSFFESAVKSSSEPHYAMHLKEPIESVDESTEEIIDESMAESLVESGIESTGESSSDSETTTFDNDFEIKIVGGDPSDPNEFPYFGT